MIDFTIRPLSWSAISSFKYDKNQWARKYLDGIIDPPSQAMQFGNVVGNKLATDPKYLSDVPRYKVFEKCLYGKIGDIKLIGFLDSFDPETKAFYEYKTSSNKTRWTQETAEAHGQLLMYKFLIYLNYGTIPEEIKSSLHYIPVGETGDFMMEVLDEPIQHFEVSHTTLDVLKFAQEVKDIYAQMQLFALSYNK